MGLHGEDNVGGGTLLVLDQNRRGQESMTIDSKQHGSWKRRARANSAVSGKENAQGKLTHKDGSGSKRDFQLRDEGEEAEMELHFGKKLKSGMDCVLLTDSQVEEANQKWPQKDQ